MNKPVISVASGKGGTGKTTVASCLALSAPGPVQFLDCDVEEPNAGIFLKPELTSTRQVTLETPAIDYDKCTFCGKCANICMYNALAVTGQDVLTFTELCHGCGGCWLLCPEKAVNIAAREIGAVERGTAFNNMDFSTGKLNVGTAVTPPVIKSLKEDITGDRLTILDTPPGTSCPVVETMEGADFVILVTEPTALGLNDLDLAVQLIRELEIPGGVIINRATATYDLIDRYCQDKDIPVLLKICQNKEIAEAYSRGTPPVNVLPGLTEDFRSVLDYIGRVTAGE